MNRNNKKAIFLTSIIIFSVLISFIIANQTYASQNTSVQDSLQAGVWSSFKSAVSSIASKAVAVVKTVAKAVAPAVQTVAKAVTTVAKTVAKAVAPVAKTVAKAAVAVVKTVAKAVAPTVQTVAKAVTTVAKTVAKAVAPVAKTVTKTVVNTVNNVANYLSPTSTTTKTTTPLKPVTPLSPAPIINSFSANPISINQGEFSTLSWSASNATRCDISGGWNGSNLTSPQKVYPNNNSAYTLTCFGLGGSSIPKSKIITVKAIKPVTCSAPSGNNAITKNAGETFTIEWCATNATNCQVTGPGPDNDTAFSSNECSDKFTLAKQSPGAYEYKITGVDFNGKQLSDVAKVTISGGGGGGGNGGGGDVPTNNNNGSNLPHGDTGNLLPGDTGNLPGGTGDGGEENGNSSVVSTCSVSAFATLLIAPKNTTTLTWSCDQVVDGCAISDDNAKTTDIGAVASSDSRVTPQIDATTTFTLQCPGANPASVIIRFFNPFIKEIVPQ